MIINIIIIYALRIFLGSLVVFFFAKYSNPSDFSVVALAFTLGALLHVIQDWGLYYSIAESWREGKKFFLKSLGLFRVRLFVSMGGVGLIAFIFLLGWVGLLFWISFMLQSICVYFGYHYRLSGELNKERNGLVWAVIFFIFVFFCFVFSETLSVVTFSLTLLCSRLIQFLVVMRGFPFLSWRFLSVNNIFSGSKIGFWRMFSNYGLPMLCGSLFILIDSLVVNYFVSGESAALYQYGYRFVSLAMVFLEILVFLFYSRMNASDAILRGSSGLYLGVCILFLIGSFVFFIYLYGYGSCFLLGQIYCQAGQWGWYVFLVIFFKVIMSACSIYMLLYRSGWLRVFPGVIGVVSLVGSLFFFIGDESDLTQFYKVVLIANFFAAFFSLFLFLVLTFKKGVRFV